MLKIALNNSKYQPLIEKIEDYFTTSNIVLQDRRNIIKEIDFDGEKLVVKVFKQPIFIQRIIYSFFKKSKAKRAYEFGLKISDFTPSVIGYIEYYHFFLLKESYFICQKFEFDFDIRKPLLDDNFADRVKIFQAFADFVFKLHQNNIQHNDLSPGNVLIKEDKQNYEFKIVDINRMIFKPPTIKARAKNFAKLWADDTDLTLILKEYAQIAALDSNTFIKLGLKHSRQHKQQKIRKRKIKQFSRKIKFDI